MHRDVSLGRPGAGLIGACSHAGPGSCAAVCHLPSLPSPLPSTDLTGLTTLSLIPSLIHLRPEPFGAHHLEQAAWVADPVDLTRTQPRRLGKRVGEPMPTTFTLAPIAAHSSELQQPVRSMAALGKHLRTRQAAPSDRDQGRACNLHPDVQVREPRLAARLARRQRRAWPWRPAAARRATETSGDLANAVANNGPGRARTMLERLSRRKVCQRAVWTTAAGSGRT
jgi:hypothetical protein